MIHKEDFVSYEQAVKLKKLGFNWDCDYVYCCNFIVKYEKLYEINKKESISAPTLCQVQKWLREVKNIDVIVLKYANDYDYKVYYKKMISVTAELFDNYEKALSAGIDEVIDYLIEEQ